MTRQLARVVARRLTGTSCRATRAADILTAYARTGDIADLVLPPGTVARAWPIVFPTAWQFFEQTERTADHLDALLRRLVHHVQQKP